MRKEDVTKNSFVTLTVFALILGMACTAQADTKIVGK